MVCRGMVRQQAHYNVSKLWRMRSDVVQYGTLSGCEFLRIDVPARRQPADLGRGRLLSAGRPWSQPFRAGGVLAARRF